MTVKKINKKEKIKTKVKAKAKVKKTKEKTVLKKTKSKIAKKVIAKKAVKTVKKVTPRKKKAIAKAVVKKVENKKEVLQKKEDYFAKWIAPEYLKTKQDVIIYYFSAGLSIIAIIWFFWQGSYLTVVTFLILFVVVILYIYQEPRDVEFKIDLDGIYFGEIFYKYIDIESFEVIESEDINLLKFKSKGRILPFKEVQIVNEDPRYIRAILDNFLLEEKQEESLFGSKKKNEFDEYFSEEDFEVYLEEKEKVRNLEKKEGK